MIAANMADSAVKLVDSTSNLSITTQTAARNLAVLTELKSRPSTAVMEVNYFTTAEEVLAGLIKASNDSSKLEFVFKSSDDGSKVELWREVLDWPGFEKKDVPHHISDIDAGSLIITIPTFAHQKVANCFSKILIPALGGLREYTITAGPKNYDLRKRKGIEWNLACADGGAFSDFDNIMHYPAEVGYTQSIAVIRHKMMVQRHLVPGIKVYVIFYLFDDKFQHVDRYLEGAFNLQVEIWEPTVSNQHEAESTCGFGPLPSRSDRSLVAKVDSFIFEKDDAFRGILRAVSKPDTDQLKAAIAAIADDVANLGPNDADDGDPVPDNWVEIDTEKGEIYHIFQPAGVRSADHCFDLVRRRAYIARYPEAIEDPVKMTIIGSNGEIQNMAAERAFEFDLAPFAGVLHVDDFFQRMFQDRFGRQYNQQMIPFVEDPEEYTRAFALDGYTWILFRSERVERRKSRKIESDWEQENATRERERQEIEFERAEQARLRDLGAFRMPLLQQALDGIDSEEEKEGESRYRDFISREEFNEWYSLQGESY